MATPDGTRGDRQARQVRLLLLLFFFLLSSFLLLTFTISFVANCSNRRGGAEWDRAGRDNAGGDSNAGRDGTGGRRAEGGDRRREEGGLAGNLGTAEAEGQVTKGRRWELRGADGGGRRGGWAGEQVRAEAGQHGCCPASALAIWSRHGHFFPKSNAVK